jgi:hypothetical protein
LVEDEVLPVVDTKPVDELQDILYQMQVLKTTIMRTICLNVVVPRDGNHSQQKRATPLHGFDA